MGLSDEDMSLRLYETLVQIGVSEKLRLVSREWFLIDVVISIVNRCRHGNRYSLHFGSSIEGSSVDAMASDVDTLVLVRGHLINNALEGLQKPAAHLIVKDEWTFPGYVKLQEVAFGLPLDITYSPSYPNRLPDTLGRLCIKRVFEVEYGRDCVLYRMDADEHWEISFQRFCKKVIKHGPANRVGNLDTVFAYESYNVLNIIPQWLRRKRLYHWPSTRLLDRCSLFPTFLVKVGHPFSKENEIEFRISFSLFERELMFSLNPTQHKCYVILKLIKNDILNQAKSEEFITSYHLKTCVFWAVENTPEEMWRPEQLLQCVCICLWYLLYFVLIKNCPNYFLPAANLFQRPDFSSVQSSLSYVIIQSVTELVNVLCRIKCANVGHIFEGCLPTKTIDPCATDEITYHRFLVLQFLRQEIGLMATVEEKGESIESKIRCWKNMLGLVKNMHIPPKLFGFDQSATKVARNSISLQINLHLARCFAVKAIDTLDKSERLQFIKSTMDCSRELFTARLVYLTLLFKLNRLSECEELLNDIEKEKDKSKISVYCQCKIGSHSRNDITEVERHDISTLFKNQMACMVFMPEEKRIVPEPLDFELDLPLDDNDNDSDFDSHYNMKWGSMDGGLYFLFMKYLVYSGLNNVTMKTLCLIAILLDVASGKMFHQAVAYNLMGWICAREGMLAGAVNWWRTSQERHPRRNAVNRYRADFSKKFGSKA